jgi:hypothetical protein
MKNLIQKSRQTFKWKKAFSYFHQKREVKKVIIPLSNDFQHCLTVLLNHRPFKTQWSVKPTLKWLKHKIAIICGYLWQK